MVWRNQGREKVTGIRRPQKQPLGVVNLEMNLASRNASRNPKLSIPDCQTVVTPRTVASVQNQKLEQSSTHGRSNSGRVLIRRIQRRASSIVERAPNASPPVVHDTPWALHMRRGGEKLSENITAVKITPLVFNP